MALAVGSFVLVTSEFMPIGLLSSMASVFSVPEGRAGLLVTVPGLAAAAGAPLTAVALSRLDRRRIMLGLTTAILTSNALVTMTSTFEVALAGRVLLGLGSGGFWVVGISAAARLVPARSASHAVAVVSGGIAIGTVLGLPLGATVGHVLGWRAAFGSITALAAGALLVQLLTLPAMPSVRRLRARDLLAVTRTRRGRAGLIAAILIHSAQFTAYTFVTPYLEQRLGVSGATVGTLLLLYGIAGLAGNFAAGAAARRFLTAALLVSSAGLGLTVLALGAAAHLSVLAIVLLALWGASWGMVPVTMQTWMMRAEPGHAEGALSLFVAIAQLSLAVGAAAGGVLVDHLGLLSAFRTGGILSLTATLATIAVLTVRRRGRPSRCASMPAS
ncbi:MFS transporter [Actinopolymorpha pittospori]|uniref:MFS family arabinose efflux permease n=1 Tax=Actinopolymorpha pittospori TaxID=648752 RepID=A0A927MWZ4_9ACTN|nr:MFS transporter [Actinopolymorpha pittospori]MBE1608451.1 putative MFS family arabinose efflux permease [Actinopolymorpha pittospori]